MKEICMYHGVGVNVENGNLVFCCKNKEQIEDIIKTLDPNIEKDVLERLLESN